LTAEEELEPRSPNSNAPHGDNAPIPSLRCLFKLGSLGEGKSHFLQSTVIMITTQNYLEVVERTIWKGENICTD